MKNLLKVFITGFLSISFVLISCNRQSREIFRFIPETAVGVFTFHPGNLLEKGKVMELNLFEKKCFENKVAAQILQDPASSGIDTDRFSAAFISGKPFEYHCVVLPLLNFGDFEQFLSELENEAGVTPDKGKMKDGFEYVKIEGYLIVYDHSIALVIHPGNNTDPSGLVIEANELISLEKEFCILSDKDFNHFLGKQKDLNAWFTTTNMKGISAISVLGDGIGDLSGISNNYGHVFVEFQKGYMALSTNLRFNQSMQITIDKYNFLDEKAIKELLKYLPSKDIVFIANTNLDPEKIFDLLKLVNRDLEKTLDHTIKSLNLDPEEVKNAVSGEFALSFHGLKNILVNRNEDKPELTNSPSPDIVAAFRIKNKLFFEKFLSLAENNPEISKKEGYYIIHHLSTPVFMMVQGKDMVLSSEESVLKEIAINGMAENNVTSTEYEPILTQNPVCFFLNLDKKSYSRETGEYLQNEMGHSISSGIDTFGDKLKSLTFSAKLEEWEIRLDMSNDEENSLYTLLEQIEKNR